MLKNASNRVGLPRAGHTDAEEHRSARRGGQFAAGWAVALFAVTVIAAILGSGGIALTAAGLCLALMVVAALLIFESEHHVQVRDRRARRHRPRTRD
jgi:uncharacterized membrane protein YtjA (UPF0391 family)